MEKAIVSKRLPVLLYLVLISNIDAEAKVIEWSDTALSWRYGKKFAEPFNTQDISKNIVSLTHTNSYPYGINFLNIDFLMSDTKDPDSITHTKGAKEVYAVYRNTFDFGKISGRSFKFGPINSVGATLGFDWNTKGDIAYNSRKRMLVFGPTLMWNVPGFLNTSLLFLNESNAPSGLYPPISNVNGRYTYKTHPMLALNWGIPLGSLPISFQGFALFIAAKGKDETGNATGAETNIDMALMWDLSHQFGLQKNTLKCGFEYQYWRNKFGNTESVAGPGSLAKTPMIRFEYHF